jgi:diguanylate cyclase (GGDEF)-like protein
MPDIHPAQTNKIFEPSANQPRTPLEIAAELNASAIKIQNISHLEARKLYQQAYDLVCNIDSCRVEMALSLAGLAYLNNLDGDIDLAVDQNFEVISLLINHPPSPALAAAYCNLSFIFFLFGEFPNALDYASKALKTARELKDNYWEADALDIYGFVSFGDAADVDESSKLLGKSVQLFGEIDDKGEQSRVYNNLADIQLRGGRWEAALETIQKSIVLAKEASSPLIKTIAEITRSEVLTVMGEYAQAENFLLETLGQFTRETPVIFKVYFLKALAKVNLMNSKINQAETNLLEAIEMAKNIKSISNEAWIHQALSEVYERKQEYSKSLEHLKLFVALNEKSLNENTLKRFHALKAALNLEAVQRDAEIHRLKNVELQNEINERIQIQKELETLATTDPLTGLFNRRHFFYLAKYEIEQACRFKRSIAFVLIDLDDFKHINDTFGHSAGDSVLSRVAGIFRESIRTVDILCRYGGEEFAILMPETDAVRSEMIIQRVRKALKEQVLTEGLGSLILTFSAGVASFGANEEHIPEDLEILIKRADQALYDAKHAGKNRTIVYSS